MAETKTVITKEIMSGASTYVPLALKTSAAQEIAQASIEKIELNRGEVPPRYIENPMTKARCLMGVLLCLYLHIDYGDGDNLNMPLETYDEYAGAHLLNQIERMKSDALFRDKAFDLLADYRDFEKRVNCEIYTVLGVRNDTVARLGVLMNKTMTPEEAQKALEEIEKLKGDISVQQEKHDEMIENWRKEDETALETKEE